MAGELDRQPPGGLPAYRVRLEQADLVEDIGAAGQHGPHERRHPHPAATEYGQLQIRQFQLWQLVSFGGKFGSGSVNVVHPFLVRPVLHGQSRPPRPAWPPPLNRPCCPAATASRRLAPRTIVADQRPGEGIAGAGTVPDHHVFETLGDLGGVAPLDGYGPPGTAFHYQPRAPGRRPWAMAVSQVPARRSGVIVRLRSAKTRRPAGRTRQHSRRKSSISPKLVSRATRVPRARASASSRRCRGPGCR